MEQALQHLRVLEISDSIEIAYGGKLLSDYGAEVIKIETPDRGDPARYIGPFKDDRPDHEASGAFLLANTNKKGITLDITTETGKEIFRTLIKSIDILLEGYMPGAMEKMGLGFDDLVKINPGLIMASVTPFGQTGPYKYYKGYPLNFCHGGILGWILPIVPKNDKLAPVTSGGRSIEMGCGQDILIAVLGGMFRKTITGKGYHIDLAIQETVTCMHGLDLHMHKGWNMQSSRWIEERAFANPIKCKDGYFMIYSFSQPHDWKYIKNMVKIAEFEEERFNAPGGNAANWPEMEKLIEKWAADHTKEELLYMCQSHRVAGAPCNNIADLYEDTQLAYRGFFVNLPHEKAGSLLYPSVPAKYSKTPVRFKCAAPLLGEHNEEIFSGKLGYDKDKIKKLRETKVI